MLTITSSHREIWSQLIAKPELTRILRADIIPPNPPWWSKKNCWVQFLILHLNASFKARQRGMEFDDDGLAQDIRSFFALPIPRFVWNRSKRFQSLDFVEFVESHLSEK